MKVGNVLTKILGHRGAMGYRPENTMSSFLKAIKLGANGIEFDVHLTKDNIPVVIHDGRVDRTTDRIGEVREYNYNQIRQLEAGSWFSRDYYGERIPSLEEVLLLDVNEDFIFNIELKAGSIFYPEIEKITTDLIYKYSLEKNVIISSFDHNALVRIKKITPEIQTGALVSSLMYQPWDYLKKIKCEYYHPDYKTLEFEFIENARENNILINTYTVNNVIDTKRLIDLNVNIIISNYPDLGISLLNY